MSPSGYEKQTIELAYRGVGQIGSAIAEPLQDAGLELHLFDPKQTALASLVARAGGSTLPPTGVADAARIVFARLPSGEISDAVVRDVAAGSAVQILCGDVDDWRPAGTRGGTLHDLRRCARRSRRIQPWLHRTEQNVFEVADKLAQARLMKLIDNLVNAANMVKALETQGFAPKASIPARWWMYSTSRAARTTTLTKVSRAVLQEAQPLGVPMWVHQEVGPLGALPSSRVLGQRISRR